MARRAGSEIASAAVQVTGSTPVCIDRHVTPLEKTPLTITLSAADLDNQATTLRISTGPSYGVLGPLGPVSCSSALGVRTCSVEVSYLPTRDGRGWEDDFYFIANDGQSDSQPGRVHITVLPDLLNDPPTARTGGAGRPPHPKIAGGHRRGPGRRRRVQGSQLVGAHGNSCHPRLPGVPPGVTSSVTGRDFGRFV